MCIHVSLSITDQTIHLLVGAVSRKDVRSPGDIDCCELRGVGAEDSLGPLPKQQVLLTAEPSL